MNPDRRQESVLILKILVIDSLLKKEEVDDC